MDGRRRLVERLGAEAADPIEELLNAALAFENDDYPSLQRFIDWFDRGEVEIVRDAAAQGDSLLEIDRSAIVDGVRRLVGGFHRLILPAALAQIGRAHV